LSVEGRKRRGRLEKRWLNAIECDMRITGVCLNDLGDWISGGWRPKWLTSQIAGKEVRRKKMIYIYYIYY